jgi:hypothetical protein
MRAMKKMTNPEELRKLAEGHAKRKSAEKYAEQQERESQLKRKAAADLDGWRRNIERAIKLNAPQDIHLSSADAGANNRAKSPFVKTDWYFSETRDYLQIYATELERLLGPPFTVSISEIHMDATLDIPWSSDFRFFTVSW